MVISPDIKGLNMNNELLTGDLVHLSSEDPQISSVTFSRWRRDSEYSRLLDNDPARLPSIAGIKDWIEKEFEKEPINESFFLVRTRDGNVLIGFVGLFGIQWNHGDAWVGIGIGDRQYWGKGFGTDVMRVILRYAFTELNLHRVTLGVFEYNSRAIRSYQKAGFTIEGRLRQYIHRESRRWDEIIMGILREDWMKNGR
jgi:RimJ/RimL family protein N-acetyltransferase